MHDKSFLNFFELREAPFNGNLDPRYLLVTPQLEQAFSRVMDAVHRGDCFAVITGEVGTGKTTFLHRLRRQLVQQGSPTALLSYPHLDGAQLLDFVLADFGIPSDLSETIDGWKRIENWLVDQYTGGQTPVLLVDEAQGLPRSAFQEIRRLLNFGGPRERLLHVVLAGGLGLDGKLKRIRMRELQKRITTRCQTAALTRDETFDYIRNRLRVSGAPSQHLFEPDAADAIYLHSRGVPRVINVLCEQALIALCERAAVVPGELALNGACADQARVVTPELVQEVVRNFEWAGATLLPTAGSPASLAIVDAGDAPGADDASGMADAPGAAPDPPILAPAASLTANQDPGPDEQPAVSPRLSFAQAASPLATKTNQQPAPRRWSESPFWAWWFYGSRPSWWNQIEAVANFQRWRLRSASPFWAWWFDGSRPSPRWSRENDDDANLPRWRRRYASLQRWLNEPVYPFQRDLGKPHSGNTKRGLPEKSM